MKTKPFNLEEALAGKPVVTRNGKKVTNLTQLLLKGKDTSEYVLAGVVEGHIATFTIDGRYNNVTYSTLDLVMDSETKEGWIAYGNRVLEGTTNKVCFATHVWPTENEAIISFVTANNEHPVGTVKVTWEV
jgi:hypothetical protein